MSDWSDQWSWDLPDSTPGHPGGVATRQQMPSSRPPAPKRSLPAQDDFRRTVLFTIAGTILPGLGLIAAKRRVIGGIVLGLFGATVVARRMGAGRPAGSAVDSRTAGRAQQGQHRADRGRPGLGRGRGRQPPEPAGATIRVQRVDGRHPGRRARLRGGRADGGGGPLQPTTRPAWSTRSSRARRTPRARPGRRWTPQADQGRPDRAQDPWAGKPRLNVLLLGGDAGQGPDRHPDRHGDPGQHRHQDRRHHAVQPAPQHRPDAVPGGLAAAQVLPERLHQRRRQQRRVLPQCDVRQRARAACPKDVLGPTDNLGADALKLSVGEALGLHGRLLRADQPAGLQQDDQRARRHPVNINTYIPIGGNTDLHIPPKEYLHPGPNQHLNGRSALWYARGRYGSDDFARMDRQRCVINAIIKQANPANMLARYEDIAKAGKDDRLHRHAAGGAAADGRPQPAGEERQRPQHRVQARRRRLPQPEPGLRADAQAGEGRPRRDQAPTSRSKSSKPGGSSTTQSEDVNDTCAYNPKMAATAQPPR